MSEKKDDPANVLKDILREKNLWQIFKASLSIKYSRLNIKVGCVAGFMAFLTCCFSASRAAFLNQFVSLSTIAFNTSVSLLGFLIAGFSFFTTVTDKSLYSTMAERTHTASGLSFLKYNLFSFMRVFIEFLVLCIFTFIVLTLFSGETPKDNGIVVIINACCGWLPDRAEIILGSIAYGIVCGAFVYLLMQLKSFIYNVYSVVMTSVRWEMQNKYYWDLHKDNLLKSETENSDEPTQDKA